MSIPVETMNELLTLVHAQWNNDGSLKYLRMPSNKEIESLLPLIGGKNLSNLTDEIHVLLEARVREVMPKWKEQAMKPSKRNAVPRGTVTISDDRITKILQVAENQAERASLEARVRSMSYDDLIKIIEANGLEFKRDAPNKGVLVMRARNTIYNALKAGKEIKA